jgi:hypothetical protein
MAISLDGATKLKPINIFAFGLTASGKWFFSYFLPGGNAKKRPIHLGQFPQDMVSKLI